MKNPIDIAIETLRADGAELEDIAYALRRAADELVRNRPRRSEAEKMVDDIFMATKLNAMGD